MAYMSDDEASGRNWLWIAGDEGGHLAAFQTFGGGWMPAGVRKSLGNAEVVDAFLDDLFRSGRTHCLGNVRDERLLTGGAAPLSDRHPASVSAFIGGIKRAASSGLFIYYPHQASSELSGYLQVGYPSAALTLSDVPPEIRVVARRAVLRGGAFRDNLYILPRMLAEHL